MFVRSLDLLRLAIHPLAKPDYVLQKPLGRDLDNTSKRR
jgi:hypothetical protein